MSKAFTRGFLRLLVWLYRRSGGRIGGTMLGAPVLLLTTTGRRSGRPWTTPLIYQPDGDRFVIVASNGGADRNPGWWRNLRSQPDVTVQIGREVHPVKATTVTGTERDRLWELMVQVFKQYDTYQSRTTRQIPVVLLERR